MGLQARFEDFIEQKGIHADNVLLAVSGGIDSVVMAHLFQLRGEKTAIAHCNFCLRADESDADAVFVRQLAQSWNIPFFEKRFDTKQFATQQGLSTQLAARELRYQWFQQLLEQEGFAQIATAHHLNDSIETSMAHFFRGTGLKGLTGIPEQNGRIIRPLLFATRKEIEQYAQEQGLKWREDSSNESDAYLRNRIRRQLSPVLNQLFPQYEQNAAKTLQILDNTQKNYAFLLQQYLSDTQGKIPKELIEKAPSMQAMLFDWLYPLGFTADQVAQLELHWDQAGFELYTAAGNRLLVDRVFLFYQKMEQEQPEPFELKVESNDMMVRLLNRECIFFQKVGPEHPLPAHPEEILVDLNRLKFPLTLRHWRAGDNFQPFGMQGKSKKVQDYLTDQKLSRLEKEQCLLLENGDGAIVWIVGMRMDERFRITTETTQILRICL